MRPSLARFGVPLALAVLAGGGSARPAHAAELASSGPRPCPDAGELAFRVERALGGALANAAPLRFSVRFDRPRSGGYRARLVAESDDAAEARSERELSARDCDALADAVAVVVALALGAPRAGDALARAPAAERGTPSPPRGGATGLPLASATAPPAGAAPGDAARGLAAAPDADEPEAPSGAERRRARLQPALGLALVGDLGSLPGAGVGVDLGAELRRGRLALRVAGTLFLDRHVALPGAAALGADMRLALGALSACTTPLGSASGVAAFACAGWELGYLEAVGTGVQEPRRGGALWSAPRIDVGLGWRPGGGALRSFARATLVAPLRRDEFYLRELGTVHRPPAIAGRLSLGLDVDF